MEQTRVKKSKGDFYDFVIHAQRDKELSGKFFSREPGGFSESSTADDLFQFFQENGYDIPLDVCEKLIAIRDELIDGGATCNDLCEMILEGRGY